jgi:hypothetical protein
VARRDAQDSMARSLAADRIEPRLAKDPMDRAEQADPIEPMDSTEPIDPIERTDPREAMQRIESSDRSDHRDPATAASLPHVSSSPALSPTQRNPGDPEPPAATHAPLPDCRNGR